MSNGTSASESRPPSGTASPPAWGPPKAPLAPHRLAKLANALGVSTPIPALHPYSSLKSNSSASSSSLFFPDGPPRRSPTPVTASTSNFGSPYSQSTSKFLLHVVPPLHLPHDFGSSGDSDLTPPPSSAPGYHAHFRRGTLVPMHATLHSQLGAIAKEYALPNTTGMILYLVSANPSRSPYSSPVSNENPEDDDMPEPGPRLSEDIWKHLWIRVTKAERDDDMLLPPRSPSTSLLGLAGRSSPFLPQEGNRVPTIKPIPSRTKTVHPRPAYPNTASSSTVSDASDLRSHSKSAPPSSSSLSQSEPGTPDTSPSGSSYAPKGGPHAERFHLPGLNSSSLIPILAKVEFDIDKKKASWYEPWLRSRRINHAKRAESQVSRSGSKSGDSHLEGVEGERRAPLNLKIVEKMHIESPAPSFLLSSEKTVVDGEDDYEQLSEDEGSGVTDQEEGEEVIARVSTLKGKKDMDPLSDVFGSDADTWADLHAESVVPKHSKNPNVVELALDGSSLTELPDQLASEHDTSSNDADEIQEIIAKVSKSPTPETPSAPPSQRQSLRSSGGRKPAPPPLVIRASKGSSGGPGPSSNASRLAYLRDPDNPEVSPTQSNEDPEVPDSARLEKRDGAIFEDGLNLEQMSTTPTDPDWKSQYVMKNELDAIEKKLARFSPRQLLVEENKDGAIGPKIRLRAKSYHSNATPRKGDNAPAVAVPHLTRSASGDELKDRRTLPAGTIDGVWPAVPPSTVTEQESVSPPRTNSRALPKPQLPVNGIASATPKGDVSGSAISLTPSETTSHESESRMRDSKNHEASYPALVAPTFPRKKHISSVARKDSSPIIPMSPDPFSRFSSHADQPGGHRQSSGSVYWESGLPEHASPPRNHLASVDEDFDPKAPSSSRFSADSITGDDPANGKVGSKLMSVVTIKKLWRKSAKSSISSRPPSPPPPTPTIETFRPSIQPNHLHPSAGLHDYSAPSSLRSSPQHPQLPLPGIQERPTPGNLRTSLYPPIRSNHPSPMPPSAVVQEQLAGLHPTQPVSKPNKPQHLAPVVQSRKRHSPLDGLHFDQDSPYPVRNSSQESQRPIRDSSFEETRPSQQQSLSSPPRVGASPESFSPSMTKPRTPPPIPVIPEKERSTVRKSILKSWKSNNNGSTEKRASGSGSTKYRRPSVVNISAGRESVEIPPSPAIPESYSRSNGYANSRPRVVSSPSEPMMTKTPALRPPIPGSHTAGAKVNGTAVPPRLSMKSIPSARSRDSPETRPSFDSSQFEMVSPKSGTLSYPYNTLDN